MKTITLNTRHVDCKNLSKEEFVKLLSEDISQVEANVTASIPMFKCLAKIGWHKHREEMRRRYEYNLRNIANRTWKKESTRNAHVAADMEKYDKEHSSDVFTFNERYYLPTYFDFDGNCDTSTGINNDSIIKFGDTAEKLGRCFGILKHSKFFDKAIGWQFEYRVDEKTWKCYSRPEIKLIFSDEVQKEIVEAHIKFCESVNDFYNNSNYWGD